MEKDNKETIYTISPINPGDYDSLSSDKKNVKIVRIEPPVYPESQLISYEKKELNTMKTSIGKDGLKSLIRAYNDNPNALSYTESCYIFNYLLAGKLPEFKDEKYGLYIDENGKKLILSEKEANDISNFTLLNETEDLKSLRKEKILKQLIQNGFSILDSTDEILAICYEKNIIFYSDDIDFLLDNYEKGEYPFYQQPYISGYGGEEHDFNHKNSYPMPDELIVGAYCHLSDCSNQKVEFPLFTSANFLNLYSRKKDNDNPYIASLKRIYDIPDLFDIVGASNQNLISDVLSYESEKGSY